MRNATEEILWACRAAVLDSPLFPYGGGNLAIGPLIWLPKSAFSPKTYHACRAWDTEGSAQAPREAREAGRGLWSP